MGHHQLDALDKKILAMLSEDVRVPFLEISRKCGVSGAAVHQRVQKMMAMDIIRGSQYTINPEMVGFETCAFIGLSLKNPEDYDMVVEGIKKIPEVTECHFTTGGYDLFIKVYAHNNHHLMNIIHDKLQPLGLARSETIISFHNSVNRTLPTTFK